MKVLNLSHLHSILKPENEEETVYPRKPHFENTILSNLLKDSLSENIDGKSKQIQLQRAPALKYFDY